MKRQKERRQSNSSDEVNVDEVLIAKHSRRSSKPRTKTNSSGNSPHRNHIFSFVFRLFRYFCRFFSHYRVSNKHDNTENQKSVKFSAEAQVQIHCPNCLHQMNTDLRLYSFIFHAIIGLVILTLVSIGYGFISTSCHANLNKKPLGTTMEIVNCNLTKNQQDYLLYSLLVLNCLAFFLGVFDKLQQSRSGYRVKSWLLVLSLIAGGVPGLWIVLIFSKLLIIKGKRFAIVALFSSIFSTLWIFGFAFLYAKPEKIDSHFLSFINFF